MKQIINHEPNWCRYKLMDKYSITSRTECLRSLLQSVCKASGYVMWYRPEVLERISAMELIEHIANNNIRFKYSPNKNNIME